MKDKQKRFCEEYVKCLNVVQAAKITGYSRSAGYKLMKLNEVQEEIENLKEKTRSENKTIEDEIIEMLKLVMNDERQAANHRIKAAEVLCRIMDIYGKEINVENKQIEITGEEDLQD